MALATYSDLQTAVVEWLARTGDTSLVTRAPDFISLFEADIKTTLRVRFMETIASAPTVSGTATIDLPTGYLEMRNIYLSANPKIELHFLTPQQYFTLWGSTTTGQPKVYSIQASTLYFGAIPDAVYTVVMNYYGFTSLSDAAPTNWLMTNYPGAYLNGALYQAACYVKDPEAAADYQAKCELILDRVRGDDRRARFAGTLTMRSDVTAT